MKKILLISYYWPPSGGGGVHRWLKMSKYLPEFGVQPLVFTAENAEYPVEDPSLAKEVRNDIEVIKHPIWEPYSFYKSLTGRKKSEKVYSGFITEDKKESFAQKASVFIRGNFFIPDARMFWVKPATKFLLNYLKEHKVDAIVSNGPPHTCHLIGLNLKKATGLPWLADFRDPWTNIDFYDQLKLTNWADKKHKRLEKEVLENADKVVTVSWSWAQDFRDILDRDIEVITNGFDPDNFANKPVALDESFSITHVGSMNKDRNPHQLWEGLAALTKANPVLKQKLKIRLVGSTDFEILGSIEKNGLKDNLEVVSFLPHSEAIEVLKKSQILLLPINDTPNKGGVLPGKLYEYLGATRPILCIGPAGSDAERILSETDGGARIGYQEVDKMKTTLSDWFTQYEQGNLTVNSANTDKFSRKALAGEWAELIGEAIQNS